MALGPNDDHNVQYIPGSGYMVRPGTNGLNMAAPRLANNLNAMDQITATLPDYKSVVDPTTGKLIPGFNLNAGQDVTMDANIQSNPWVQMMLQSSGIQTNKQLGDVAAQGNAGLASSYSALATRGGLSAGARERLATKSARDVLMGKQDVQNNANVNNLGIMTTGTQNQENLDLQNRAYQTDVDKANIQTQIANKSGQDQFNLSKYSEQMKAWAAERTAEAQENAGKK